MRCYRRFGVLHRDDLNRLGVQSNRGSLAILRQLDRNELRGFHPAKWAHLTSTYQDRGGQPQTGVIEAVERTDGFCNRVVASGCVRLRGSVRIQ